MLNLKPHASVIIPNYNGSQFIDALCNCLIKQKVDSSNYEIIIVDNGSTDDSLLILKKYQEKISNLKVFEYKDRQSSYAARNFAVTRAQTNLLVFTDADCQPEPDWLSLIIRQNDILEGNALISGDVLLQSKNEAWSIWEWYDKCTALNQKKYSADAFGATANLAVPRKAYNLVNGFSEVTSGGDRDFCTRVAKTGFQFRFFEFIRVKHPARRTRKEVIEKQKRVGLGKAQIAYNSYSLFKNIGIILKNTVGCFFQLNQSIIIAKTFMHQGMDFTWKVKFLIIAYYAGFVGRHRLIKNLTMLILRRQKGTN